MLINEKTTLKEILRQPWAAGREYMIDPGLESLLKDLSEDPGCRDLMKNGTFSSIRIGDIPSVLTGWGAGSLIDGLNFLEKKALNGTVFYDIWDEEEKKEDPSKEQTGMSAFPMPGKKPFFVICPGGGYSSVCSIAEGFPIAMRLNELGYSAFVVHYRVGPDAKDRNPVRDLAAAVRTLKERREQFGIGEMDYYLTGFSAGGHLAGLFGTEKEGASRYGVPSPKGMVLGYPVLTMGDDTHEGSRSFFLGEDAGKEIKDRFSVEKQITPSYPPTFLWQCAEDDTVPAENSKRMAEALQKMQVPFAYEVFEGSAHGWGLGSDTAARGWLDRAVRFLISQEIRKNPV